MGNYINFFFKIYYVFLNKKKEMSNLKELLGKKDKEIQKKDKEIQKNHK